MVGNRTGKGILIAAAVWLVLIAIIAVIGKSMIYPMLENKLKSQTGSKSHYKYDVSIALDSFSGYCVFRSEEFKEELKAMGIRWTVVDDQANYEARIKALKKDKVQFAVFPLNSMIEAGADDDGYPATAVAVIDETKGADAIISYKTALRSLSDLNSKDARMVFTPGSPSEFLSRIVVAQFSLPNLPEKWWKHEAGAKEVYEAFKASSPTARTAYALWEPYVSKALEEPGAHVLLDSSKLKGYILDILFVQREFLAANPQLVRQIVEAYFRVAYRFSSQDKMIDLVMKDSGESRKVAEQIVKGIQWKNTLENYAYFAIVKQSKNLESMEDIIEKITDVLVKTGKLKKAPLKGSENTLYYDCILKEMYAGKFHPGKKVNVIDNLGLGMDDLDKVREDRQLVGLTDDQWEKLLPVGTMRVAPISFGRGSAVLNIQSNRDLDLLVKQMVSFPGYYLLVVGHARADGDMDANMALARNRAEAARERLISGGLAEGRVKAKVEKPSGESGDSQSVSFIVGQMPY